MCNIEFPLTMKKIYLFNKKKWHKFVIKILLLLIFCFICSTMIWSQTALHCKHHCCFIWNRFNIPFTYIHKILILYILHCTSITHAAVYYFFFFFLLASIFMADVQNTAGLVSEQAGVTGGSCVISCFLKPFPQHHHRRYGKHNQHNNYKTLSASSPGENIASKPL